MATTIDQMAEGATPGATSRLARVLALVPRALSSKPHIVFLTALGVYLVLLPLAGVHVSSFSELVGGNYTNVTSDLGACIAAGGTLKVLSSHREHRREIERLRSMVEDLHRKLGEGAL
ncbi:MAG: hypothetical protein M0010_01765 [Actinomycetota bacterium]|jgi:predicted phage tail protein|nr:hypothetical protein [Actinomycetota bacterium]